MISKGTQIRISVNEKSNENGWSAKIIPTTENDEKKNSRVSFQIDSPANAIIGKYTVNHFVLRKSRIFCSIRLVITRNSSNKIRRKRFDIISLRS